jgi:hypothetical protein
VIRKARVCKTRVREEIFVEVITPLSKANDFVELAQEIGLSIIVLDFLTCGISINFECSYRNG